MDWFNVTSLQAVSDIWCKIEATKINDDLYRVI